METTSLGRGLPAAHPMHLGMADSALVRAATMRPGPRPVWFMRQAGRSLPEYRRIREGTGMLQACFDPSLVAEITLQPVRRHGVDAAILFSDIVVPLRAVGIDLDIVAGVGPVVAHPVRSAADVAAIGELDPAAVAPVAQGARLVVGQADVPLIGFAGAPFTLASYLIEGGPSRTYARTKALMHGDPLLWHDLASRLARVAAQFLRVQILSGASAVQLFDSWAGALSLADYRTYVLPHSAAVFDAIADLGVPRIHFGVGTGELLAAMAEPDLEVVGVDFRVSLTEASRRVGPQRALQGNLDPALLQAPRPVVAAEVARILSQGDALPGHIFNLGHGVTPDTDPDVLTEIVAEIHRLRP